jgi:hypothetical protein
VIEAKIENRAKLMVVDPRFARIAWVVDIHAAWQSTSRFSG